MLDIKDLDLKDVGNLNNFSGCVPLFPLSTVVFFPNTLLPLHIFEPRYKQMINDTMSGEKIIAMALFKPGWEKDYYGNPDVYTVTGIGRIVSSETIDDGKYNIVLYGLKRARITNIVKEKPYRLAEVELVENEFGTTDDIYRQKIADLVTRWNFLLDDNEKSHRIDVNTSLPLENLTDALATLVISNVFDKQRYMEEPRVESRAKMLIAFLQTRLDMITITSRKRDQIIEKRNLN